MGWCEVTAGSTSARRGVAALLMAALVAGAALVPLAGDAAADTHETFHLRNANRGGGADIAFSYGRTDDRPIAGDWNGDGRTTIGIVRGRTFHLRDANRGGGADVSFTYGRPGDIPIAGDWNGDGRTTIGIVRGRTFHLRNDNSSGPAHLTFRFGRVGDLPVTGDWDGDGRTTIGVMRGRTFYLRDANAGGPADLSFRYGRDGDIPITGDWDRDGRTTIGIVRGSAFHLRDEHQGGAADASFRYGRARDVPITGDWDRDGATTVGIVRHPGLTRHPGVFPEPRLSCEDDAPEPGDEEVVGHVRPPENLDLAAPSGPDADLARAVHDNALRYALGTHYEARYAHREQDVYADVLGDSRRAEYAIRLPASTAVSTAIALRTGGYDAAAVGRPEAFAYDYATWLTRSIACQHRAITTGGWGNDWQSAFWAFLAGKAGWLLWDRLGEEDRFYVARMVEYEANRFVDYEVPYWRDAAGNVLHPGDSKAEENSWNANVLQLATAMMPDHPNWRAWQRKNVELLLSSYSVPSDLDDDRMVHGQPLSAWLSGHNANEDGTVVNHDMLNPSYMSTIHQNWSAALTYGLAGQPTPAAAFHNGELVYGAFSTLEFPDSNCDPGPGTIFREGTHWVCYPDSTERFPEGYSWGPDRPAPFMNLDAMADAFGLDGRAARPAAEWEELRAQRQLELQSRPDFGDGRTYVAPRPGEDRYLGREEYVAQILSFAWLTKYVAEHAPVRLDEGDYSSGPQPFAETEEDAEPPSDDEEDESPT